MPRFLSPIAVVLACLWVWTGPARSAKAYSFYVSPEGNDTARGTTVQQPFRTLGRARDAVRQLKLSVSIEESVTVYLRGGTYEVTEALTLEPIDSGTADYPVVYRAHPEGGYRVANPR